MAEAAYNEAYAPGVFVTKDAFDIHVRSMRDRADSEEKLSDAKFERLEALIAGSIAEQRAMARETGNGIKAVNEHIRHVEERIGHVEKNLDKLNEKVERMQGDISELKASDKALTARLDTQQTKFGWSLTVFGIIITVVIAAIQLWK